MLNSSRFSKVLKLSTDSIKSSAYPSSTVHEISLKDFKDKFGILIILNISS